jgi:hypothetical protein
LGFPRLKSTPGNIIDPPAAPKGWSPTGGEIFYRERDAMMAAAARTRPGFEVAGPSSSP